MDAHRHFLRNEFAMVEVSIEAGDRAQVLRIRNTETDEEIALDPLELEALTRMTHRQFGPLILTADPGAGGGEDSAADDLE